MARDIKITPNVGTTASNQKPEILFNGLDNELVTLEVQDNGSVTYLVNDTNFVTIATNSTFGIGTATPSNTLHVTGTFRLEDGTENIGYVLTTDNSGVATWTASSNVFTDNNGIYSSSGTVSSGVNVALTDTLSFATNLLTLDTTTSPNPYISINGAAQTNQELLAIAGFGTITGGLGVYGASYQNNVAIKIGSNKTAISFDTGGAMIYQTGDENYIKAANDGILHFNSGLGGNLDMAILQAHTATQKQTELNLKPIGVNSTTLTTRNSQLNLLGEYWNGSAGSFSTASIIHNMTATTPTSQMEFFVGNTSSAQFYIDSEGVVSSGFGYSINGQLSLDVDSANDSVVVGLDVPSADSVGLRNTLLGINLPTSMTGQRNSLFGWNAGASLTSGGFNMFIGAASGQSVTTASYNVAIGTAALQNNETGQNNVAIGGNAGQDLTSTGNILIGRQAGRQISTGINNVGIGYRALEGVITGSRNIAFGDFSNNNGSGFSETISFGYNSSPTASNQWVVGSDNFEIYDYYWGQGQFKNSAVNTQSINWYSTSVTPGVNSNQDISDENWTFNAGRGTGAGGGSNFVFRTAPPGTTGTASTSLVEQLKIHGNGDGVEISNRIFYNEVVDNTGSSFTADLSQSNMFRLTATDNFTLDYTNAKSGSYTFIIEQGGAGPYNISYTSSKFRAPGGTTPTLTSSVGAIDILSMIYSEDDGRMYVYRELDFQDI